MATTTEAKTNFARKVSQLVQCHDLDATTLDDLSTLFTTLGAIETTGVERHRDIAAAIETWISSQ